MSDYQTLALLLGRRDMADVACPSCGPFRHSPANRMRRVLRLWRLSPETISHCCARCGWEGFAGSGQPERELSAHEKRERYRRFEQARRDQQRAEARRQQFAAQLWRESLDSRHTWVENYLNMRGIELPAEDYLRRRTLRFHPFVPFGRDDPRRPGPTLLCAFEPILNRGEPLADPPVTAIHRIRGRGHANKKMLGPVKGQAVMISPFERVGDTLNICEGVETGLKLYQRGVRPLWAMGSAGGIAALPILEKVRRLAIWADNDETGIGAARRCAERWAAAGSRAVILYPPQEGRDHGET
ncbi:toprim domain-containing protein [Ensifer adhaerens]|uniref:toprim domain-containing protein n=1 Tax=Ensifer adhaerens TaxID=106592 RepID=UPI0015C3EFAC|nr:toprim domain-containing protein [Ensifer adhaerens]